MPLNIAIHFAKIFSNYAYIVCILKKATLFMLWAFVPSVLSIFCSRNFKNKNYINIMQNWWLRQWRICLQCRRPGFNAWVGKIPWRRAWKPTPIFLPGEFQGQRSLADWGPWGHKRSQSWTWLNTAFNIDQEFCIWLTSWTTLTMLNNEKPNMITSVLWGQPGESPMSWFSVWCFC